MIKHKLSPFLFFIFGNILFAQALSSPKNINTYQPNSNAYISSKNTISRATFSISNGITNSRAAVISKNVSWGSNIKGEVGESIVEKLLIPTTIDNRQKWTLISPRYAPQGLDHLAVRWKKGRPAGLLVAETKVNSSVQHNTKYGYQMSDKWIGYHLTDLKNYYGSAGKAEGVIQNSKIPRKAITCKTHIKNSQTGEYEQIWSADGGKTWNYTGKIQDIELAKYQCRLQSQYFEGCANGQITYKRKLYRVDLSKKKIYDTQLNGNGEPIIGSTRKLPLSIKEFNTDIRNIYSNYLQKIYRMSPLEAKILSKFGKTENIANGNIKLKNIKIMHGTYQLTSAVLISAGINVLMQIAFNKGFSNFSFKSVGIAAGIGAASMVLSYSVKSLASFIASHTTLSLVKTFSSIVSSAPGINLFVSIIMAVGGYKMGLYGKLDLAIQLGTVAISTGLMVAGHAIGATIAANAVATGAAVGSAAPVIGTAIGAAIGFTIAMIAPSIVYKVISEKTKNDNLKFLRTYSQDKTGNSIETQMVNRKYFST